MKGDRMTSTFSKKSFARVSTLALTVALGGAFGLVAHPGVAQAKTSVDQLEQQIQELQGELQELRSQQSAAQQQAVQASSDAAAVAAAQAASAQAGDVVTYTKKKGLRLGGVNVKVGGFIAAEGVERSAAMGSDMDNRFGTVPQNGTSHDHELRFSGRQSRLSIGVTGDPDSVTHISAYLEADFMGAGSTSNSKQSNSYVPRLRQAWAGYERADWGLHVFGGQMWTLATSEKKSLLPGNEATPMTIDNSILDGFTYGRQPGFRVVKDFGSSLWAALSVENPQTVNANSTLITGNGNLSGVAFTTEVAPDVIAKVATDTRFGQFAVFGIASFYHNEFTAGTPAVFTHNGNEIGGGIGADAVTTIVPKLLDFQANFLWGQGTGRYGAANLNDVAVNGQNWGILRNIQGSAGFVGHVTPALDVYTYGGLEQVYGNAQGSYGSNGNGAGQLHRTEEGTVGFWWKFYQGSAGLMQTGLQYAWLRQDDFGQVSAAGVTTAPGTHGTDNVEMVSLRYYPFQ
jgi:hypothetical protein